MISHDLNDLKTYAFLGFALAIVTYLSFRLFSAQNENTGAVPVAKSGAETEE